MLLLLFFCVLILLRSCDCVFMGVVMVINLKDKILINGALETEIARVKRAINSEKSQAIKEIHGAMLADLQGLLGRVVQEPAK